MLFLGSPHDIKTGNYALTNMDDTNIFETPITIDTTETVTEEQPIVEEQKVIEEETKLEKKEETLESLEEESLKTADKVPLKSMLNERGKRREAEDRVAELERELTRIRESGQNSSETVFDVRSLSDKHGIDEDVLSDILQASYTLTKSKVKEEIEKEIAPKLAEAESIKREREAQTFNDKFQNLLNETLSQMPDYKDLVDSDDVKDWVRSGKYSKLTMSELLEKKYSKFIPGKKSIESGISVKEVETPKLDKMTVEDYARLEKDPEFKKKWSEDLENRLRNYM